MGFGERYRKREYVGAGFVANNPVREVVREVIVSICTSAIAVTKLNRRRHPEDKED